jgi:hypothetical protein
MTRTSSAFRPGHGRGGFSTTTKGGTPAYTRVKPRQTRPENVVDLKDAHPYGNIPWCGLTPDDSSLFVRDASTDEIYGLDLDLT